MRIWFVEAECELNCAWTKKEDAIAYVKNEAEKCNWNLDIRWGSETDEDTYVQYEVNSKDGIYQFDLIVYPTFLDEKPYLDV